MKQTLNNDEVTKLFGRGKWVFTPNVSAIYSKADSFKYMVSAPLKKFRKATDRNKIKRMLRNGVVHSEQKNVNIAFIYKNSTIINSEIIKSEIKEIFNKIK